MKKIILLLIAIILSSISYARPIINDVELLGKWSSANDSLGNITLEFHGFNAFASDKLMIYYIDHIDNNIHSGVSIEIVTDGYYGNYNLKVTIGKGILIFSGLWLLTYSHDHTANIFLAKESNLEEFKKNSLWSDFFRSILPENMKARIRLKREVDTAKLMIVWKDFDYYLHHRRVFFSGENFKYSEKKTLPNEFVFLKTEL